MSVDLHYFADRIARLEESAEAIKADIKDEYAVAASKGFNARALRKAIKPAAWMLRNAPSTKQSNPTWSSISKNWSDHRKWRQHESGIRSFALRPDGKHG